MDTSTDFVGEFWRVPLATPGHVVAVRGYVPPRLLRTAAVTAAPPPMDDLKQRNPDPADLHRDGDGGDDEDRARSDLHNPPQQSVGDTAGATVGGSASEKGDRSGGDPAATAAWWEAAAGAARQGTVREARVASLLFPTALPPSSTGGSSPVQVMVDTQALASAGWIGVPHALRAPVWATLLGYAPASVARRVPTLTAKRRLYLSTRADMFPDLAHDPGNDDHEIDDDQLPTSSTASSTSAQSAAANAGGGAVVIKDHPQQAIYPATTEHDRLMHQIYVDIKRTYKETRLFAHTLAARALERILFVWAVRHPGTSYVQGMNDIVCVFFIAFVAQFVAGDGAQATHRPTPEDTLEADFGALPPTARRAVEADTFWALTRFMDGIQDHYTADLPGIRALVARLDPVLAAADPELAAHLTGLSEHIPWHVALPVSWNSCLLVREMGLANAVRLFDVYIAEIATAGDFREFHVAVSAVLLASEREVLLGVDREERMLLAFQALSWNSAPMAVVETLLSEAFVLHQRLGSAAAAARAGASDGDTG